jgi:methylmalonyl-CoA mutase C-terminal domain/subunit
MAQETGRRFRVIVTAPAYSPGKLFYPDELGAKWTAAALREAGFGVIATDLDRTPETIVNAALRHSADAIYIAVEILHVGSMLEFPDCLKRRGLADVLLLGGAGMGHQEDAQALQKLGFDRIFGPGNRTQDIAAYLREELPRRRPAHL